MVKEIEVIDDKEREFKIAVKAYKDVFTGPKGELVLADLAKVCRVTISSHVSGDPYETAFNEGKREVYNSIVKCINFNFDQLKEKEAKNE